MDEKPSSSPDNTTPNTKENENIVLTEAFHQYCMATWDSLPVCILCGLDVDVTNTSSIRFCKSCAGYAHVTCIANPCDDWTCPFCSRTDDPYLRVSYKINDKQFNMLTPFFQ